MQDITLSPTDFVALVNQTLEFAYPTVTIEGELCNFRVTKNRWVYFSLKDDVSTVDFFGTVYQLPGPLQDGLNLRVTGSPRLHARFGFSVNINTVTPAGEGSLKKAADLLRVKLQSEGLFEPGRKRLLPRYPAVIGLVTADKSAAFHDFVKILDERWGGVDVWFYGSAVGGEQAPTEITAAIEHFNQLAKVPDVLVITRGGGSTEDLAAFNDERVVRAVAASRIPTIVAIGHEIDESLAELAADRRASTPSNAAQVVVPDRRHELTNLSVYRKGLTADMTDLCRADTKQLGLNREYLTSQVNRVFEVEVQRLNTSRRLFALFNPEAALRRGYAIVRQSGRLVASVTSLKTGDHLDVQVADGKIKSVIESIN